MKRISWHGMWFWLLAVILGGWGPCVAAEGRADAGGGVAVGSLGNTRRMVFEGNAAYPEEILRRALAIDLSYVLASHPSDRLDRLLSVIERRLVLGYQHEGFRDAAVKAGYEAGEAGGTIRVRVDEGRRFRMGRIRIEGARSVDADRLGDALTRDPDVAGAGGMATRCLEVMKPLLDKLPAMPDAEGVQGAEGADEEPQPGNLILTGSSASSEPDWTPGGSADLTPGAVDDLRHAVRRHLAQLGRPQAEVVVSHVFGDDGTVELLVRIENEGEPCTVGQIKVLGNRRNPEEEIIRAAGLASGMAFTPGLLQEATVALWRCGRFHPFAVDLTDGLVRGTAVDLTIRVVELEGVPLLADDPAPHLEVVRRFIDRFNGWMAGAPFTEFMLGSQVANGGSFLAAFSATDGMWVEFPFGRGKAPQQVAVGEGGLVALLHAGGRKMGLTLPLPVARMRNRVELIPAVENDGKVTFQFSSGFSSKGGDGRWFPGLLVAPAVAFLKADLFKQEGDQVVVRTEDGREWLRLDMRTAMPVSGGQFTAEIREGCVRERIRQMGEQVAAAGGDQGPAWPELVKDLCRDAGVPVDDARFVKVHRLLGLAGVVLNPATFGPFRDLWRKWSAPVPEASRFLIPQDADSLLGSGEVMGMVVGLGAVYFSDLLAPPDSWLAGFGRELVFMYGGRNEFTAKALQDLLDSPAVGPIGCRVVAAAVQDVDPGMARRFRNKALAQADAAGFRKDWRLLLDPRTELGKAVEGALQAFARLTAEEQAAITGLLDPGEVAWFQGFLGRVQQWEGEGMLADWMAPEMDRLWDGLLEEVFRKEVGELARLQVEPTRVAALVNGHPVPRILVRAFAEGAFDGDPLAPPRADPAKAWTGDPALASAVRLCFLRQAFGKRFAAVPEERIAKWVDSLHPEIAADDDAGWRAVEGATRRDLIDLAGLALFHQMFCEQLRREVPVPDAGEVEAYYRRHQAALSRKVTMHAVTTAGNDMSKFGKSVRGGRLIAACSSALEDGLPFHILADAAKANSRSALKVECLQEVDVAQVPARLLGEILSLQAGAFSKRLVIHSGPAVVGAEDWTPAEPVPLERVRERLGEWMTLQRIRDRLEAMCRMQEGKLVVEVLEDPQGGQPGESAFGDLLKSDPFGEVGLLGFCWEQALAGAPGAGAALEELIATGILNTGHCIRFADAMLRHGRTPLAARCYREARETDPAKAAREAGALIRQHREAGRAGQAAEWEKILRE